MPPFGNAANFKNSANRCDFNFRIFSFDEIIFSRQRKERKRSVRWLFEFLSFSWFWLGLFFRTFLSFLTLNLEMPKPEAVLFVGNLSVRTSEDDLRSALVDVGVVDGLIKTFCSNYFWFVFVCKAEATTSRQTTTTAKLHSKPSCQPPPAEWTAG